jgi:hypothetical protein
MALYAVGGIFVLLGFAVSVSPPKTAYWKAAGVVAFLVVFYAGFVVTKEQATRMTLAAEGAKAASISAATDRETDIKDKAQYGANLRSLQDEMKGMKDIVEAYARGSNDPKWSQLLAQVNAVTKANAIKVTAKEPPRFALDSLSVTTSFPPVPPGGSTSTALAKFHVIATNVGESTAHGWRIQIQMEDQTGGRYVLNSMEAKGSVADDTEPGRAQVFSTGVGMVIPFGCGPQIIRVWMKYGDLLNPAIDLPPQIFYRRWGGWNNPNSVTEVRAEDVKPIEAMFARDFPMPQ